jgi:hypothetical protein
VAAPKDIQADFGSTKYRVGVQIKSGAYVPDGTTTIGSVVQIVEKQADGTIDDTSTCTTDTAGTDTVSYCPNLFASTPGDSVEITQVSAPDGLVIDPTLLTLPPCTDPIVESWCFAGDQLFTDNGLPPEAANDEDDVLTGGTVDIPVLENDDLHGAPITDVQITGGPEHGTASVVPPVTPPAAAAADAQAAAAGPSTPVVRYVPDAGYVGPDTLQYTVTTANGSATGSVAISVLAPPPTAHDDRASTTEGHPVTVHVTANDDAAGGGALRVDSVGNPADGTVRIKGHDVVYTPDAGFVGTDQFTYAVETDFGTDTGTVTVRVVAAPTTTEPTSTPPSTTTPAAPSTGTGAVASTGTDSEALVTLGGGLLFAGGVATAGGRRRRRRAH